jgi:hypothetical protein
MVIAEELAKKTPIDDITGKLHTIQDRIAPVKRSRTAIGEIPTPEKMGRPSKMAQEVVEIAADRTTDNSYLRRKTLTN